MEDLSEMTIERPLNQAQQHARWNGRHLTVQSKILILLLVLSLTPLLCYSVFTSVKIRKALTQEAGKSIESQAVSAMGQLQQLLFRAQEDVQAWSQLPQMTSFSHQQLSELFSQYQSVYGMFASIVYLDIQGKIMAASSPEWIGKQSDNPFLTEALQSQDTLIGGFYLDSLLSTYGVSINAPVFSEGELKGVLSATLRFEEFQNVVDGIQVIPSGQDRKGFAVLVDGDGFILVAPQFILFPDQNGQQQDLIEAFTQEAQQIALSLRDEQARSGIRQIKLLDETFILAHAEFNEGTNLGVENQWRMLVFRDAREAISTAAILKNQLIYVGLVTCVTILIAALLLARAVTQPIRRLTNKVRQLHRGDLDVSLRIDSNDEVGVLADAFDNLRNDIKHRMHEISSISDRYQNLVESVTGIVWEAELEPVSIRYISGQCNTLLGYEPEWFYADANHWLSVVMEDDRELFIERISSLQCEHTDQVLEHRVVKKNGDILWFKNFFCPVMEGDVLVGLRGVAFDITDIKQAEEEMGEARDLALRTAQSKSEFLAIMSHELRTPVNGMLGMLTLMDDKTLTNQQKQYFHLASASAKQLVSLLDDILDYSKIENGQLIYQYQNVPLREFLEGVISLMAAAAFKKGLDIGLVLENGLPETVLLDPTRLRQVLVNLISNAIKFTETGSIWVWGEVIDGDRLYVEVKDTGIGISPPQKEMLFEPFVLADQSSTRKFGGSGLGLFLCKKLLSGMDGSISVNSIEKVGSSFAIELPVEVIEEARPSVQSTTVKKALVLGAMHATEFALISMLKQMNVIAEAMEYGGQNSVEIFSIVRSQDIDALFIDGGCLTGALIEDWQIVTSSKKVKIFVLGVSSVDQSVLDLCDAVLEKPLRFNDILTALVDKRVSQFVAKKVGSTSKDSPLAFQAKVLLVEDNLVNQKVALGMLKKFGLTVDLAENGEQAVSAIEKEDYDLVLMDCQMPVMDGYTATELIRGMANGKSNVPIVAVTANAMDGDRERCLDCGMNDFVAKPLKKDMLIKVLQKWLNGEVLAM